MGKLGKVCKDALDRDNDGDVDLDDIKDIVETAADGMQSALDMITSTGGDAIKTLTKVLNAVEGLHIEGIDTKGAKQALQTVLQVITQVAGVAEHLKDTPQPDAITFSDKAVVDPAASVSGEDASVKMSNDDEGSKEKVKPS